MKWILILIFGVFLFNQEVICFENSAPIAHMEGESHEEEGWGIGELHPLLVHFPIVLITMAFVFDLLYSMGKITESQIAPWIVIVAAAVIIPTVITGLIASEDHPNNPYVLIHRAWALTTLSYTLAHAIFRGYVLQKGKYVSPLIFVFISLINLGLVSITAEYGATVTHGRGLFIHPVKK